MLSSPVSYRRRPAPSRAGAAGIDVGLSVLVFGASVGLLADGGLGIADGSQLDSLGAVLAGLTALPVLGWRRNALGALGASALASIAMAALGYRLGVPMAPTVAIYLAAMKRTDQRPWTRRTGGALLVLLVAYITAAGLGSTALPGPEILHTSLAWALAWFAGDRTRLAHAHIAELADRAWRVEHDAERDRRLAVAEERMRIARDVHDSAGHTISIISLRAGTARLRHDEEPQRSREALAAIEELARQAAGEIDQIVSVLRDEAPTSQGAIDAPAGMSSLPALVARHADAGLEVSVRRTGFPVVLDGPVDQAAYRILQEALSNAARHGAGPADVALDVDDAVVALTITNATTAFASAARVGHGLVGMRERAALLGGRVDVDREPGTFRLRAWLPRPPVDA